MKYTKHNRGNYNLHIIETDRFKTVQIFVNFKRELRKEEITIRNFLTDLLVTTSKKYPTRRELVMETENLYNIEVNGSTFRSGKYSLLSFRTIFLNEKYTEEGMNEKSIAFFLDLLFHPNITAHEFDEDSFTIIKNSLEDDIKSTKDNPDRYSMLRMLEFLAPNSKISYHPTGYLDDLEKITRKSLYSYYQEVIQNSIVDVFVIGEIKPEQIKSLLEQNMNEPINQLASGEHIVTHTSIRKEPQIIKESMPIKQSKLVIGCKVEELTAFERQYVMSIYSFILGGSGDSKLFQTVREKNSLCYYISASYNYLYHLLTIHAGIDKKDFELAYSLIQQELESMKNGEFEEAEIEKGKQTFITGCMEVEDSPGLLANAYLAHEYVGNDFLEERMEQIKKVDHKMIVNLAKKVHLDTIYLLEGDKK